MHIRFEREANDDAPVVYRVETPDFSEAREWQEIGRIEIDRLQKTYRFLASGLWTGYKFIPPSIYGLDEATRERLLREDYAGYEAGGWSASIHRRVTQLLEEGRYP